jgi:hypothetical protein
MSRLGVLAEREGFELEVRLVQARAIVRPLQTSSLGADCRFGY